jgi:type I restriction enzyme S subunit
MEVKARYKQTEVGIIPFDWELKPLNLLTSLIIDGTHVTPKYKELGVPFLRVTDIQSSEINFEDIKYISHEEHNFLARRCKPEKGDLLLSKNGTIGIPKVVTWNWEFSIFVSLALLKLRRKLLNVRFLEQFFKSNYLTEQIQRRSKQGTVTNLHLEEIREFLIPLPPTIAEQEAIAEALSDADDLIEALEQLLAKKRQVKQGAMQELLMGKRRLPGFSDDWEVKRLGDIAEIVSGGTPSTRIAEYWNGDIDWCTPTDITSTEGKYLFHTEKRITEAGLKNSSANLLPKGTLLLCSRATIGEVKIATDSICTNQGFKSLICSKQVYNEFLYYVILTLKPKLLEKGIGSTFMEISKKDTAAIEIKLPSFEEQTAIAEILSDMDNEIVALETKLAKARQVKQGMMQELLTGRIRLV